MGTLRRKVLAISTTYGTEADELLGPIEALKDAGLDAIIASIGGEQIQTLIMDKELGTIVDANIALADVITDEYDALLIPGGTLNADSLRTDSDAQRLVKEFAASGKLIASICHGPWVLVSADLLVGKSLTSYRSLSVDITNAGGNWVDEKVVVDHANGFSLITSRTPDDLHAFNDAMFAALV